MTTLRTKGKSIDDIYNKLLDMEFKTEQRFEEMKGRLGVVAVPGKIQAPEAAEIQRSLDCQYRCKPPAMDRVFCRQAKGVGPGGQGMKRTEDSQEEG